MMCLPLILTGPILRRVTATEVVVFVCTSEAIAPFLEVYQAGAEKPLEELSSHPDRCRGLCIGERAFVWLLHWHATQPLPRDKVIEYDLIVTRENRRMALNELLPDLCYEGARRPSFVLHSRLEHLLHGSCCKPHFPGEDALVQVDALIAGSHGSAAERPALLMMSGDQIYADDVAGPMLKAIHGVIDRLGLRSEYFSGAIVENSSEL